jgi:tetratricopeptide (TPR) repeat protein
MTRTIFATLVTLVLACGPVMAAEPDSLITARDLYSSAAYEDALSVLNRLRSAGVKVQEGSSVEQYRALCLLALGRNAEAQDAIEAVVAADPLYRPSDADVSPRIRTAFTDVRKRMLPAIVQQRYALAKAAFDRKDYATAADGFSQLLLVFADSDLGAAADQPPIADLRTLAAGFQELSAKAVPPPAPVQMVAAPVAPEPASVVPLPPRIFSTDDAQVVPPTTVRQDLPPFTARAIMAMRGTLEVVINENGLVESATIRQSINRAYDTLVVESALKWRYTPATFNGAPVKFRKMVGISVSAAR